MLSIRHAKQEDAAIIAQIHTLSRQATYQEIFPASTLAELVLVEQHGQWQHWLSNASTQVLLAEIKHTAVGFISFGPCRDAAIASNGAHEIYAFYVLPVYRRQGIGHVLLGEALNDLRSSNAKVVTLWVLAQNKPARQFYAKQGFQQTERRKRYQLAERMTFAAIAYDKYLTFE